MRSSSLLSVAVLLPFTYAQLNDLAVSAGLKYFGSATDNSELTDTQYTAILSNTSEFGQITPGNTQKWEYTEATENTFDYSEGDVVADFASNNSQILRCHNLIWYQQLPSWVSDDTWTNETLIAAMKAHIQSEVTHYKGQCYAWDVVNEAFDESGNYRSSIFYETIGSEYIPIAFETAALYDSDVKLYYNDYNIEYSGAKSTAALNLVKDLKARGIQIDGVGMQGHYIVGSAPSLADQTSNLQTFIDAGVEVAYTELDIRFSSLPPTSDGLATQATEYANTVQACLDTMPGCVGVTIWDYTDKYSWVPDTYSGAGDACLWYANYTHHPAYDAVTSVLASYSGSGNSSSTTASSSATSVAAIATTLATSVKSSVVVSSSVAAVQTSATSAVVVAASSTKKSCSSVMPSSSVATVAAVSSTKSCSSVVASSSIAVVAVVASSTKKACSSVIASTASSATASSTSTGTVAMYGQCGGANYSGSTTCVSGSTCTYSNDYYSQCL